MKKARMLKIAIAMLITATLLVSLVACDSDDTPDTNTETGNTPGTVADAAPDTDANAADNAPDTAADDASDDAPEAVVDVYQDLQDARAVVSEHLEWFDNVWTQIMLADDVPSPEMKYGQLVVPFFPSDLTRRHTRTVDISDGNFVIEITSADTGIVWSIDQDGNINQVG